MRVIAIDGPAGSGKSTVAKALARRLGLEYLDTGAMYRAIAFAALSRGVDPEDTERVADIARSAEIEVDESGVRIDGVDATVEIRGPEVTRSVSVVAPVRGMRSSTRSALLPASSVTSRVSGTASATVRDTRARIGPRANTRSVVSVGSWARWRAGNSIVSIHASGMPAGETGSA